MQATKIKSKPLIRKKYPKSDKMRRNEVHDKRDK
jgi:hypothetical protein